MAEGTVSGTEPLACFESYFSAIEMLGLGFMKSSQSSCCRRSDFYMQSDVQTTKDPNIVFWLYDFDVPLVLMLPAKPRVLHWCDSLASLSKLTECIPKSPLIILSSARTPGLVLDSNVSFSHLSSCLKKSQVPLIS